ncbi:MAG: hypothetical protein VKL59_18455 [Nostocaceae cyanobacterium]|nr:hypothetical protein [Nostocaceae cyanobacterium]
MSTEKGVKRVKDVPVFYSELKKKHGIYLTDTAWQLIQKEAAKNQTSASELLEKLIRKYLKDEGD